MKVSSKVSNSMQNAEAAKASKAAGPEAALDTKANGKTGGVSSADLTSASKVELSTRAQQIKKAKELATPNDGIDEAKVARLQKMIDAGQYKINAEAIADKLLDEHSKMPE